MKNEAVIFVIMAVVGLAGMFIGAFVVLYSINAQPQPLPTTALSCPQFELVHSPQTGRWILSFDPAVVR